MHVRLIDAEDTPEWLRMRQALWPECSLERHREEMDSILGCLPDMPVFVACRDEGGLGGFLEASLHTQAGGCETSPIGYIEGWYVDRDLREAGVGRMLVEMAEAWAILRGCQEMASDCELDNTTSLAAHLSLGYEEAERLIHFRKSLLSPAFKR